MDVKIGETIVYPDGSAYSCNLAIVKEDEGFSAFATNLPGCVSQGETVNEATMNLLDAFRLCLQSYKDDGMEIPWGDNEPDGFVVKRARLTVELSVTP